MEKLGSYEEHEYCTDILLGIKQMIQNHLKELHLKFQDKIVDLEFEVQKRDIIINELEDRLRDTEGGDGSIKNTEKENVSGGSTGSSNELPFMVSFPLNQKKNELKLIALQYF